MMDHDQQPELIASHVARTLEFFRNLQDVLSKPATSNDVLERTNLNDFPLQIENDFTRFKMWVGTQAAHQSGLSSLDYRLREAAHLKQQVIYLLKDIRESLQSATSLAHYCPPALVKSQEDGTDKIVQDDDSCSSSPDSDSDSDSGEDDESEFSDPDSNDLPGLSLYTILTDIAEAVDCLLRLSVAITNPTSHNRSCKLGTERSESLSFCELYGPKDTAHVKDTFYGIDDKLASALGRLITSRRQSFKIRQAHHEKLASNRETDTYYNEPIQEDALSDAETSQTRSAHHWSFADTDQVAFPLRPSVTKNGILECPFCYRMICAKTETAWERHIFKDLRPYICVFPSCINSNSDFDRRCDLQAHVAEYHWRLWSCPFKCQQSFSVAAKLSLHIREDHFPTGTEEELESITALGGSVAPDGTPSSCPFCGYSMKSLAEYIDHVGCHLEQLVLFALPRLDENLEDEIGSEKSNYKAKFGADSPQLFSVTPPEDLEAYPTPHFKHPGKGKEVAHLDDNMGDPGSSDLLEPTLGKNVAKHDSLSENPKVEPTVATPDVPADERETKRESEIQHEDLWDLLSQSNIALSHYWRK